VNDCVAMPFSLATNRRLSRWLTVQGDPERILVRVGKVEIGQGIGTALTQIAADALGLDLSQIRLVAGITDESPDELWTSASVSVEVGGASVAWACGEAREMFIQAAARRLGAEPGRVEVSHGCFSVEGTRGTESYWTLRAAVDLDVEAPARASAPATAERTWVGRPVPRLDLSAKLRGEGFVHDLKVPGMLHGRVVRRPGFRPLALDRTALAEQRGVMHVHVDGDFIGIVAADEHDAARAQELALDAIKWSPARAADGASLEGTLRAMPVDETRQTYRRTDTAGEHALAAATLRESYLRPFLAHASVGTCCAVAVPQGRGMKLFSHSQGIYPLRQNLAACLGLAAAEVQVVHMDGAGCYGHNGADDVALDAALLARAAQAPVRVAWSRREELTCAPFGSGMLVDIEASVATDGSVVAWHQQTTSATHLARPGWGEGVNLLAAGELAQPLAHAPLADVPLMPFGGGGERNAVPLYEFGECTVDYRFSAQSTLRTSALRSLGAHGNVFAIESMMDELAAAVAMDPLAIRLRNLKDERSVAVLQAVCQAADWTANRQSDGTRGWGLAVAQYKNRGAWFACVVEVELSHEVRVNRVFAAVDCGLAVNPDGVRNQIEGGIVQAVSWCLKERVTWDAEGITSCDWERYPILNFDETPEIQVAILQQSAMPPMGVGECTMGPVAAAVANAVRHALGVHVREMPITPDAIAAAIP